MRMMMIFGRGLLAGVTLLALSSCGQSADDSIAKSAPEASALPDADLESASKTSSAASPPQSCEKGAYCSGPLVVRAENLTFGRDDAGWLNVVGTLTFANRSDQDLRIALIRDDVVMNLEKGARVSQRNFDRITGLGHCTTEGSDCFNTTPDTFSLVAPGDSPAQVNIALVSDGRPGAALIPSLPEIAAGTLTMTAYAVAADGSRRLHRISLANVPVTNQLAQ